MAKRRKRKSGNSKRKAGRQRVRAVNSKRFQKLEDVLKRMRIDLERSLKICEEIGPAILDEDRHEFWALVKYTENVQEGIKQLDDVNNTIFPRLTEFPETSDEGTETSWKDLKGMRDRLAHAFWKIDHGILWDTVKHDFPKLLRLLEILQIIRTGPGVTKFMFKFKAGNWRKLPKVIKGERLTGGNSIPAILFDERGEAVCVRLGRVADDQMAFYTSKRGLQINAISLIDPQGIEPAELLWPSGKMK